MPTNVIVILLFIAALVAFIAGIVNVPIDHVALIGLALLTVGFIVERASGYGTNKP